MLLTVFLFVISILNAQVKDEVLLTIDNKPVYTSEFIRVYQKNKDIIIESSQKGIDDYLEMFVDFKLKLQQAYDLELDTTVIFKNELTKYREQLVLPYLVDNESSKNLIREAYERSKEEVNVSHILVKVSVDSSPIDTLKAYNKINEARNKVLSGLPFEEVAKDYSEDTSVNHNNGNLGYFSAFDMVYPFENIAYNTHIGETSKPFRTQFGYHILKVNDKRLSKGEIEIAHIFVKNKDDDEEYANKQINELYQKLNQGEKFDYIAKNYSDDQSSAQKGGLLPKFSSGKLINPLDSIAFSLIDIGDISEPFSSNYGWHIIKLINKFPIKSYDELKQNLKQQIENGSRSIIIKKSLAEKLKKQYKIIEDKELLDQIYNDKDQISSNRSLLIIEKDNYSVDEFNQYSKKIKNKTKKEIYSEFKTDKIIEYHKNHLEETNKDFSIILKEYSDGLLLFDLLQNNIWKKAEKDTLGLQQYFDKNIKNYYWKRRAKIIIATCNNYEKAVVVKNLMLKNKNVNEIKQLVNEGATIHVLFNERIVEENSNKLPKQYLFQEGVSKIYNIDKSHFIIGNILAILPAGPKELNETKGQVLNDYQNYLEKEWVKELHKKYKVKIDENALQNLKQILDE
ncbi:MAG: peptidylprolyl isomerase [Bacteroidota bacterium]